MNGGLLLIPFLAVRFLLPPLFSKGALRRAAYFAPVAGAERTAYFVYQISNTVIFLALFFLKIETRRLWLLYGGAACYLAGLFLCAAALISFSVPDETGFNRNGLYRYSRNPMYAAYFICFFGMALLLNSLFLLVLVFVFQISAHWIILSEERWCIEKFGDAYRQYMEDVGRYFSYHRKRRT